MQKVARQSEFIKSLKEGSHFIVLCLSPQDLTLTSSDSEELEASAKQQKLKSQFFPWERNNLRRLRTMAAAC